jgi:hypothetical protein
MPRAVLGAFMARMRGTVIVNLKNRSIGKAGTQTRTNFVKGWTHRQP